MRFRERLIICYACRTIPRTEGLLRNLYAWLLLFCRLAADSDEASTKLITESLLALLRAAPPSRDVVYVMARALARGGAFLKGVPEPVSSSLR